MELITCAKCVTLAVSWVDGPQYLLDIHHVLDDALARCAEGVRILGS